MRKSVNFSGLTYWIVTLLGWALRASGGLSANKVAMVKNRMGGLFIFQFSADEQRILGRKLPRDRGHVLYCCSRNLAGRLALKNWTRQRFHILSRYSTSNAAHVGILSLHGS